MKNSKKISILIFSILCAYCSTTQRPNYKLVQEDDYIWVEQFDSTNFDPNRYNRNNKIFKVNTSFIYTFEHVKTDNSKWSIKYVDSISNWKFIPISSKEDKIEKISITVLEGLKPMTYAIPDYNQTILSYSYWTNDNLEPFASHSGVIENEKNVWMHPPRDEYFTILELNPFPYIQSPFKVGNDWQWSLKVGEFWSDSRWKSWDGLISIKYNYKIIDYQNIDSAIGKLKCFVIKGSAKSELGETKLISYFNEKYGFVKMNYRNIDGSSTNLEIAKIITFDSPKD